jgi:uncharacterized repeat protein (TIGR03803 family)
MCCAAEFQSDPRALRKGNIRVQILGHVVTVGFFLAALAIPSTARAQYPLDVLHEFNGYSSSDGTGPRAPLIQGRDGNLYGTTYGGGPFNCGTIFRMTRAGAITVLHAFTCRDGFGPAVALLEAADGSFYVTGSSYTADGNSVSTIFKMSPTASYPSFTLFPPCRGLHSCREPTATSTAPDSLAARLMVGWSFA